MKKLLPLKMATMTSLPLPVTLVTSIGSKPNIITITYVTGVNEKPPMFGVAIRPQKYSNPLIRRSKEFVINIPTLKLIKEIDYCGTHSGRNVEKFSKLKLTPIKAKKIKTPLIAECPINIECKLKRIIELPSHDFFIGKVVALHVDKEIVADKKNKHGVFLPRFEELPFLFTTFLDYRVIGKKKGTAFQEHQKLNCKNELPRAEPVVSSPEISGSASSFSCASSTPKPWGGLRASKIKTVREEGRENAGRRKRSSRRI